MATGTLAFFAQFTASKAGVNSFSVTIDVDRITRADGTRSALKTGDSLNITIGRRGLYGYYLAGCDLDLYDYVATFITADTSVDLKEVPALWTYWIADIGDAAVASVTGAVGSVTGAVGSVTAPVTTGTVSDKTGYSLASAPPTAAAIADAVWDETAADHVTTGTTGKLLANAGAAADPLLNTVPGSYATGTAGYALGRIGTGAITAVSPVSSDGGTIHVTSGDDYRSADATAFTWSLSKSSLPTNIQSATVNFTIVHGGGSLTKAGTVTNGTDTITLTLELTAAQTALFAAGVGAFHWQATMATTSYTHTIARNGIAVITPP